jgi:CPA2 family monovalent cation:H+ antiporter-2
MVVDPVFFRDLALVFLAALLGGALAWLARQPLVLGYVLGGILVSPLTPGPAVTDIHTFELFAEIGVVLLMFSIGIEFSLRELLRVRRVAMLGGPVGIALSIALGLAAGTALGWPPLQGLTVGVVISVASTMVLARLLTDRGDLHTAHGRVMIGITLVEDLAVIVLIVVLPLLGALDAERVLAIGVAIGKAALVLLPVGYVAAKVVPPLLLRVARTRNDELFLLVALAVGVGTAALTQAVGLSLALGAFLAGLVISESDYAHETLARLLPLRDTFVAMFFVTLGALIDPRVLLTNLPLLGVMVGLVVIGKFVLWAAIVRLFGYPAATAILVGVGLTQIGEFSFVLVQVARGAGHVGTDVYTATLATALLTILLNAVLVRCAPPLVERLRLRPPRALRVPAGAGELRGHVLLCGFGRVGSAVGEALETFGVRFAVIENDPDVVAGLRGRGIPCYFGDAARPRLLELAGARQAALAVVALPAVERTHQVVRHLRRLRPDLPMLARVHAVEWVERLRQAGATETIQPELEAAGTMIRHALQRLDLPKPDVLDYLERFREAMDTARGEPAGAGHVRPEVREVALAEGPLADQSLRQARIRERFGVTVVAIARADGAIELNPVPDTIVRPGDRLRVFGLPQQIEAFTTAAGRG